jgi:hypothetical protein
MKRAGAAAARTRLWSSAMRSGVILPSSKTYARALSAPLGTCDYFALSILLAGTIGTRHRCRIPRTPVFRRCEWLVREGDSERFDGFASVFERPAASADRLRLLLARAYTQLYMRSSVSRSATRVISRR